MVNQGPPLPPPDKMKRLICLIVNSGLLRFVRFQMSILCPPDMNYHLLYAPVHRDMVWLEFLGELVKKCAKLEWFENYRRTLRERLMVAGVSHGRVESNSFHNWLLPNNKTLTLVETSVEATVGSMLKHVTTTINNTYPNVLDISFVR